MREGWKSQCCHQRVSENLDWISVDRIIIANLRLRKLDLKACIPLLARLSVGQDLCRENTHTYIERRKRVFIPRLLYHQFWYR